MLKTDVHDEQVCSMELGGTGGTDGISIGTDSLHTTDSPS